MSVIWVFLRIPLTISISIESPPRDLSNDIFVHSFKVIKLRSSPVYLQTKKVMELPKKGLVFIVHAVSKTGFGRGILSSYASFLFSVAS